MEKEFIPYKQALALKELGFDGGCFSLYFNNGEFSNFIHAYKVNDEVVEKTNSVLAPTFSQAFKWFRERYKLHSTITSISQESWQWHITKPTEPLGKLYDEDFYTYEEAELDCLKELIKIVKK